DGEQPGLVAQQLRHPLLQGKHGRVLGVHVITGLGGGHRLEHSCGRTGDGVTTQVDRAHGAPVPSSSSSATRKASSRDWLRFNRGSQTVSYRWASRSSAIGSPPPTHSVTSSPVNSTCSPPGCVPIA